MGLSIRLLASVSRAPEALDAAVASPYGWTTDISRPLALNGSERATKRRGPGAARVVLWIPDQKGGKQRGNHDQWLDSKPWFMNELQEFDDSRCRERRSAPQ